MSGERIVTARKLFNVREGWTRAEDTLPERLLAEPLASGEGSASFALSRDGLDRMIAAYYAAQGWTASGDVPPERVRSLGLEDLTPKEIHR